jgi:hypothetical protein
LARTDRRIEDTAVLVPGCAEPAFEQPKDGAALTDEGRKGTSA